MVDGQVGSPPRQRSYIYSSGTSNIISACLSSVLALHGTDIESFLDEAIFGPIGVTSARLRFDAASHWIASSYLDLNLHDWLRIGLLAIRGGEWDGQRLVPESWLARAQLGRSPTPDDPNLRHGSHWWTLSDWPGAFMARGFEGQRLILDTDDDLIVFRSGRTDNGMVPSVDAVLRALAERLGTIRSSPGRLEGVSSAD